MYGSLVMRTSPGTSESVGCSSRIADAARATAGRGYRALKFDPFGAAWRVQDRVEEDRSIEIVAAVREAVGPSVDLMIEGHERFSVSTALRIADRLAPFRPAWF